MHRTWRAATLGDVCARGDQSYRGFGTCVGAGLGWPLRSCWKHVCYQAGRRNLGLRAAGGYMHHLNSVLKYEGPPQQHEGVCIIRQ